MPENRNGLIINRRGALTQIAEGLWSATDGDELETAQDTAYTRLVNGAFAFASLGILANNCAVFLMVECLWMIFVWPVPAKLKQQNCSIPCKLFVAVLLLFTVTLILAEPNTVRVQDATTILPIAALVVNACICLIAIINAFPYTLRIMPAENISADGKRLAKQLVNLGFAIASLGMLLLPGASTNWHAINLELSWLLFNCVTYRIAYSKTIAQVMLSVIYSTLFGLFVFICIGFGTTLTHVPFFWPFSRETLYLPNIAFVLGSLYMCGQALKQTIASMVNKANRQTADFIPIDSEENKPIIATGQEFPG